MLAGASPRRHDDETSSTEAPDTLMLHAVEHDAFAINCISIALCPGLLSPMISLAAVLCLGARRAIHAVLSKGQEADEHRPPLPVECAGCVLAVQTFYSALFVYVNGVHIVGWVVATANWIAFMSIVYMANAKPIPVNCEIELSLTSNAETLSEPLLIGAGSNHDDDDKPQHQ